MPLHCTPLAVRLWRKVTKTETCWLWMGVVDRKGYGRIGQGGRHGRKLLTHRVSWELAFGSIPRNILVLHHCDVPACVNPAHLFLGTNADNIADMVAKGRQYYGERHHLAILTSEKVAEASARVSAGETQTAVAADLGITQSLVSMIVNGLRRAHG